MRGTLSLIGLVVKVWSSEVCDTLDGNSKPQIEKCLPNDYSPPYLIDLVPSKGPSNAKLVNVSLTLKGTRGESRAVLLSTEDSGIIRRQSVALGDLGSITHAELSLDIPSTVPWTCYRIHVRKSNMTWTFNCKEALSSDVTKLRLVPAGKRLYHVTIKAGNEIDNGSDSAFDIVLRNQDMETEPFQIRQSLQSGGSYSFSVRARDIGKVSSTELRAKGSGSLFCESITVRAEDDETHVFRMQRWIGGEYAPSVSVGLGMVDTINDLPLALQCFTTLDAIVTMRSATPGHFQVNCPPGCDNEVAMTRVIGSEIHPSPASVCGAALYDGVIGLSGGTILVIVEDLALANYRLPASRGRDKRVNLNATDLEAEPESTLLSYFLMRIETPDQIGGNVRIVDATGALSLRGRLEIKGKNGVWGSVCDKGSGKRAFNGAAAIQACRDMGFQYGQRIDIEDGGCTSGLVVNHCGPVSLAIAAMSIECEGNEDNIGHCSFQVPDKDSCDHSQDVLISCTNHPQRGRPMDLTLRLVDPEGQPVKIDRELGMGRLEVAIGGKYGPVCDDGWGVDNAGVACRTMGFEGISSGGLVGVSCRDYNDRDWCQSDTSIPLNITDVICSGLESTLGDCVRSQVQPRDIICSHDEDVIIACHGRHGDTGGGQLSYHEKYSFKMNKYMPEAILECESSFPSIESHLYHGEMRRGESAAQWVARCPSGCLDSTGPVYGTFVYRHDSSICSSAIHAGVMPPSGGSILVRKAAEQSVFTGSTLNRVRSQGTNRPGVAFLVAKVPNAIADRIDRTVEAMDPKSLESELHSTFGRSAIWANESSLPPAISLLEIRSHPGILSPENETPSEMETTRPVETWCPPVDGGGHPSALSSDQVRETRVRCGARSFSFVFQVVRYAEDSAAKTESREEVVIGSGGVGTRRIVTGTTCEGLSVEINALDEVVLSQLCTFGGEVNLQSGFKLPVRKPQIIGVTWEAELGLISLFINGKILTEGYFPGTIFDNSELSLGQQMEIGFEQFVGEISYLRTFDKTLNHLEMRHESRIAESGEECVRGLPDLGNQIPRYSESRKLCVSPCLAEPENIAERRGVIAKCVHSALEATCDMTVSNYLISLASRNDVDAARFGVPYRFYCSACPSVKRFYGANPVSLDSNLCSAAAQLNALSGGVSGYGEIELVLDQPVRNSLFPDNESLQVASAVLRPAAKPVTMPEGQVGEQKELLRMLKMSRLPWAEASRFAVACKGTSDVCDKGDVIETCLSL